MISTLLTQGDITNPALKGSLQQKSGTGFFQTLLPNLLTLGLVVASIITFFILLTGGIKWITSGGDKEKLDQARGTITSAIIGLVIVFALWAILQLLGNVFGINLLRINLESITIK
jgi:hypothetical protein